MLSKTHGRVSGQVNNDNYSERPCPLDDLFYIISILKIYNVWKHKVFSCHSHNCSKCAAWPLKNRGIFSCKMAEQKTSFGLNAT